MKPELQRLCPFLAETRLQSGREIQILRVGGRLAQAPIGYDAKFPVLLPKDHVFTRRYVEYLHQKHLHAGPKVLMALIRAKLWIVNARELARKIVNSCIHCYHYKHKLVSQIMGALPAD